MTQEKEAETKKNKKNKNGEKDNDETKTLRSRLASLRPKIVLFFVAYIAVCLWLYLFYDPCSVSKKRDCGYEGISPVKCWTTNCFLRGPKKGATHTLSVRRKSGDEKLGLHLKTNKENGYVVVTEVKEGAVKKHNDLLPANSEDRIQIGDRIKSIEGVKAESIEKFLRTAKSTNLKFELLRVSGVSRILPLGLQESTVGKVLMSSGFERWSKLFSYTGGVGLAAWLLSGYGVASLPVYYLTPAALLAWNWSRCCHDENVGGGVPHCFTGANEPVMTILTKAWKKTTKKEAMKIFNFLD